VPATVRIRGLAALASLRLSDRIWTLTVFDEGSTSWAPDVFEEHVSRDYGASVPEQVCKHHEFLPGQVNRRALQRDPVASGIDSEVADLEHFFLDAKRRRKSARIRASSSSVAKGLAVTLRVSLRIRVPGCNLV